MKTNQHDATRTMNFNLEVQRWLPRTLGGLGTTLLLLPLARSARSSLDRYRLRMVARKLFVIGLTAVVGAAMCGLFVSRATAGTAWTQRAKLLASDGVAGDTFGGGSISGNRAIVGAPYEDHCGDLSGAAYIFEDSGSGWVQVAKLTASDCARADFFGYSVSISGNTAIIGAPGDDDRGADSGSAYVFQDTGSGWAQVAKLTASDGAAGDEFGWGAVSISGNTALVGAWKNADNGHWSGSAYVFRNSGSGWTQVAKLLPADGAPEDLFGCSTAIDGTTAVIGAYLDDDRDGDSGSAYVFQDTGSGWTQVAKLTASDGAAADWFGTVCAISGTTVVIGARTDDDKGTDSGSAYVFQDTGSGWTQVAKLTASDGAAGDRFGGGVAINGNTVIVGAYSDGDKGTDSGSAYVFQHTGSGWTQVAKLTASDGTAGAFFGAGVAISGTTAIIGAVYEASSRGSAYIFAGNNPPVACCTNVAVPVDSNCQALASIDCGSFDPDGDPITVTQTPPGPYPLGTKTVTLTVTDVHGASNSCQALVVVRDATPPTITCPQDITAEFTNETGAVVQFSVTATDLCSAVALTVSPASGSLFPIGSTPVVAWATDAWGNSNTCAFSVTVLGARGVKENVLADLVALRASVTNREDSGKLDEAIRHLTESLDPSRWVDETHLVWKEGDKVFHEEKEAVKKLQELLNSDRSKIPDAVLQGFIDRIVRSDRLLALISIQEAAAAGVKPNKIAEDLKELAKGDEKAAEGHFDQAVEHYRHAWKPAAHMKVKALEHLAGGAVRLEFLGLEGQVYFIQASTDLVDWVTLGTSTADADGNVAFTDPDVARHAMRFYRMVEP